MELQSSLEQKGKENTWLLKASESLGPQNLAPHVGYLRVHHEFLTCGCLIWPFFFGAVEDEVRLKEGTGKYLEECRPLSRVAWYDGGREVRQDGTKVGRFGAGDVVWIPRRIRLDISVVCL